jgi:glycine/D-amino acid oxidase-like deaminating enzyme
VYDAIVLGAGIYGVKVALELRSLGLRVLMADPTGVMNQATKVNQNRVHAGYHYPRSARTAETAIKHYNRFLIDHAPAITGNYRHLYCIARESKVNAAQYEKVMREIGAPLERVETPAYFTPGMIEQTYETYERSFNINILRRTLKEQLKVARIELIREAGSIDSISDSWVNVRIGPDRFVTRYVFNCTYSNIDTVVPIRTKLVKEHVEVPLLRLPEVLAAEDITIMDGPFFSLMDYPTEPGVSAFTHVKYGRHQVWPAEQAEPKWDSSTRVEDMLEDAIQFIPALRNARYLSSMLTTRVLLAENKDDDGRPVLWEYAKESPRIISILGSKFNSVYDVIDELRKGEWMTQPESGVRMEGRRALIGRGLIGTTLDRPGRFTDRYNSENIRKMKGHYERIVIAAPSAKKFVANAHPEVDSEAVADIMMALSHVTADYVVLISTIDATQRHAYGKHRRALEEFVEANFEHASILRLPAVFGDGLQKNALYDMMRAKPVENLRYHWYPLTRLWDDVQAAKPGLTTLYSDGLLMSEIAQRLYPNYTSFLSLKGKDYNEKGPFIMTSEEALDAIQLWVEQVTSTRPLAASRQSEVHRDPTSPQAES